MLAPLPEHRALFGLLDVGRATGKPTLICGPEMAGKAAAALAWCREHALPCEAQVLNPDCTAEDLFGKLMPSSGAADAKKWASSTPCRRAASASSLRSVRPRCGKLNSMTSAGPSASAVASTSNRTLTPRSRSSARMDAARVYVVVSSASDSSVVAVLIHEATFEDDLLEDAVKKRHSTTSEAIQTGVDARCYRTILTHFSQRYPKAPKFDGHIGNGEGDVREDANQENANQDDTSDARSRRNVSDRVGVAFDLMRVDFTALPRVPSLMPAVRALFPDPVEDAAPAETTAAE